MSEAFVTDGRASSSQCQKATRPDGDLKGASLLMGSTRQGNGLMERKKMFHLPIFKGFGFKSVAPTDFAITVCVLFE